MHHCIDFSISIQNHIFCMEWPSFISNALYLLVVQLCTGQVLLWQNTLHVIHMWLFMNLATEQRRVMSPVDPVYNYGQLDEVLRTAQLFMNLPRSCVHNVHCISCPFLWGAEAMIYKNINPAFLNMPSHSLKKVDRTKPRPDWMKVLCESFVLFSEPVKG